MKHGSLISPDEATFGFGNAKAVFDGTSVPQSASLGGAADCITVPDAQLLFNGEFKRSGDDLKIVGDDGKSFLVSDYFKNDKRPTLLSPEGAALTGDVVSALAGPLAPGQYAQAGTPQSAGQAIGRVEKVEGNATVVRNGVTITLNTGDVIQKGDVAQTGAGGSLSIVFADGTAFNLAGNARMVLNDFVYSAGGSNNSALISLVQGSISFVAGQVAKTGDMRVDTPVATMGIRGTAVLVEISADNGQTKFSVMVEPNGTTGSFNLYNKTTGALIATVNNSNIGWVVTPAGPLQVLAQQLQKTPAELARELVIMQQVFQTFNSGPFDPNAPQQPPTDPGKRGDNPNPQNTAGGSGTPGGVPIDSIKFTELTPPAAGGNNTNTNTGNPASDPTGPGNSGPGGDGPGGIGGDPTQQTISFNILRGEDDGETFGPIETGPYDFYTTEGPDHVIAGGGNDTIIAGHGGGNDIYDGGADNDTIKFESANGVIFQLNSFFENGVWKSRAFSPTTGSDIFFNIENIVGSKGDDVFVLHHLDGDLHIDAGKGFDIVKLLDGVDVGADDGFDVSNFEMVDLTNVSRNVVEFEGGGIDENNPDGELRIVGDSQDIVKLTPGGENGHWEFVWRGRDTDADLFGEDDHYSDGVTFDEYVFISDEPGDLEGEVLATLYVDKDVSVIVSAPDALVEQGSGVDGTSESIVKLTTGSPYYDLTGWGLGGANIHEFGGHYYEYIHQVNWWWNNARDAALSVGGYLATITSQGENDFVNSLVRYPLGYVTFIGASDAANEGAFVWVDGPEAGQAVTFTFWAPGEPNNSFGNENYLAMVSGPGDNEGGRWNDVVNSYGLANGYLVEYPTDVTTLANVGTYGYVTLDTETNELTYHLNNYDADTQALAAGQTVTESFAIVEIGIGDTLITRHVEFTIHGSNDAPVADQGVADEEVTAGEAFTFSLGAKAFSDVDAGDTLTYEAIQLVDGSYEAERPAWLSFDPVTRTFSGEPGVHDFGEYRILVRVTDEHGASASKIFTLSVEEPAGNEAPVISINNFEGEPTRDDGGPEIALDDAQSQSTIVKLFDGSFIVVWNDLYEGHQNLRAQHFASNGTPLDEPFQITTGGAAYPYENVLGTSGGNVAVLPDGTMFVTYYESENKDVYGQFFNTSGPIGSPAEIATGEGEQSQPKVVAMLNGDLFVTWTEPHGSSDADIFGRSLRLRGENVEFIGEKFQISVDDSGYNSDASIVSVVPGLALVVWQHKPTEGNEEVVASIIDLDFPASPSAGSPFTINTESEGLQGLPTVAKLMDNTPGDGRERIVVTWTSNINPQDESGYGVFGRIYEWDPPTGSFVPVSDEFQVNTIDGDDQLRSTVTALMDGGFVVTWEHDPNGHPDDAVKMQRFGFDSEGLPVPVGDETTVAGTGRAPDVTGLYDGAFAVTWLQFNPDGQVLGIKARVYDGSSIVTGIEIFDPDAGGSELTVTVTAAHGTIAAVDDGVVDDDASPDTLSFTDTLNAINNVLGNGIIYTPDGTSADEAITLTVNDGNGGTDITNFIFTDYAPNGATLEGTDEKDVIFTTGQSDTITGGAKADTFVFDEDLIGNDTITDFDVGEDRMVFTSTEFGSFEDLQQAGAISYADGAATINLGVDGTVVLDGVDGDVNVLQAINFVFNPYLQ